MCWDRVFSKFFHIETKSAANSNIHYLCAYLN
jgi:hypothetical protein